MTILITELKYGWQILYSVNGNSCVHQFRTIDEVASDLKELKQIEINLFKCPNPAPDRLLNDIS